MKTPFLLTALRHGLLLLLLACTLHALPGAAQTPQFMTYQGYLTDQNGIALGTNGPQNYDIVFRVWNQPTGGSAPLYGELQTVTVVNGYFSVLLGEGTPYVSGGVTDPRPPLATVFTTNNLVSSARYIEMTVKGLASGSDVTILPRLQLVSAPYAFLAANANALVSATTGANLISSSGANLTINGSLTNSGGSIYMDNAQEIYAKNNSGVYEPCLWPRWSDNVTYLNYGSGGFNIRNNSSASAMWMGNNGTVGIGTTTPSQTLDVNGTFAISSGGHCVFNSSSGVIDWSGDLYFRTLASQGNIATYTDRMHITAAGNVGIGTTAPQRLFTVSGPGATAGNDGTYQAGIGSGTSQLILGYDSANNAGVIAASTYQTVWRNVAIAPGGGNVGVNTVAPAYPLDVNGIGRFSGGVQIGSGINTGLYGDGGNVALRTYSGGAIYFQTVGGGSTPMYISPGGLVGIGTTSPSKGQLELDSANGFQPGYNPVGFLGSGGAAAGSVGSGGDISIWASGWIFSAVFVAFSDERIKNIKGQSDSAADLKTLLGIKITDYTYRDTVTKGSGPQKKVVAQQVEKVYPQAVTKSTDVVPDIYTNATVADGWVQLATDLKVGDRVKLIDGKEAAIHDVQAVRAGAFRTDFNPPSGQVFVYGREVKDFRSVDYEAISMLNVSATQELAKQLDQKSKEVTMLEEELAGLKKTVAQLDADSKRAKLAAENTPRLPAGAKGTQSPIFTASRDQ